MTRYTKFVPKITKGDPKRDQNQSKRAPSSPKGVPKSIKMSFGTPLRHRARPRRKKDLGANSGEHPFWTFRAALGAPRADFGIQGVSQNHPKIITMSLDRHLGGAKWAKKASRRGLRNATENVTKQVSQNCRFWDAKTFKKCYKVIQNQGFGGSKKT